MGAQAQGFGTPAPKEIDNEAARLSTMKRAAASGQIGDSHYYLLLDAAARRMRSRYPGHREYIDNVMQDLTGTNPANRAIQELKSEINKGERGNDLLNQEHWAREHGGPLSEAIRDGRPYTLEQAKQWNAAHGLVLAGRKTFKENIDVDNAVDANYQRKLTDETLKSALSELDNRNKATQDGMGATWERLNATKAEIGQLQDEGKTIPAEKQVQLDMLVQRYKDESMSGLTKMLQEPFKDAKGRDTTLASAIGVKNVDDLYKSFKLQLDATTDLKSFKTNAAINEAKVDAGTRDLFNSHEQIQRFSIYQKAVSPQVANTMLYSSAQGMSAMTMAYRQYVLSHLPEPTKLTDDLTKGGDNMRKAGRPEKEIAQMELGTIDGLTAAIKSGKANPQEMQMIINKLYGDDPVSKDFWANATTSNKDMLFEKMVHPEVTNQVFRSGDAATIGRYKSWVDRATGFKLDQDAKNIKTILDIKDSRFGIKYNPENVSFSVDVRKPIQGRTLNTDLSEMATKTRVETYVNSLNKTIAHYGPVAEKLKITPQQRDTNLKRIFKLSGIDLETLQ